MAVVRERWRRLLVFGVVLLVFGVLLGRGLGSLFSLMPPPLPLPSSWLPRMMRRRSGMVTVSFPWYNRSSIRDVGRAGGGDGELWIVHSHGEGRVGSNPVRVCKVGIVSSDRKLVTFETSGVKVLLKFLETS